MKKSWKGLTPIVPDEIDWKHELELTLKVTGWTKVQLAECLGLYIQRRKDNYKGGDVSPHFYHWLSGKYKPKPYLLFALRYIRLMEGKQATPASGVAAKRKGAVK